MEAGKQADGFNKKGYGSDTVAKHYSVDMKYDNDTDLERKQATVQKQ